MNHSELAGAKKDDVAWASRYVGVALQNRKQQKEAERPWRFYRREVLRSEENIFLVDRNPIWMTIDNVRYFSHIIIGLNRKAIKPSILTPMATRTETFRTSLPQLRFHTIRADKGIHKKAKKRRRRVSSELTSREEEAYTLVHVQGKTAQQAAIEMRCTNAADALS